MQIQLLLHQTTEEPRDKVMAKKGGSSVIMWIFRSHLRFLFIIPYLYLSLYHCSRGTSSKKKRLLRVSEVLIQFSSLSLSSFFPSPAPPPSSPSLPPPPSPLPPPPLPSSSFQVAPHVTRTTVTVDKHLDKFVDSIDFILQARLNSKKNISM